MPETPSFILEAVLPNQREEADRLYRTAKKYSENAWKAKTVESFVASMNLSNIYMKKLEELTIYASGFYSKKEEDAG